MTNPTPVEHFVSNEKFLIRQFVVARINRHPQGSDYDPTSSQEDEPVPQRHYAMATIMYLEKELINGCLIVRVNLPELDKECEQVINVTNLISLEDLPKIVDERKEELSNILFERLVIDIDPHEAMSFAFDD